MALALLRHALSPARRRDLDEIRRALGGVDGWLTDGEAMLLHELARAVPAGQEIVEVGSWKGRSTICLALGARAGAGGVVHAIDPHTGSEEHHAEMGEVNTLAEFRENVRRAGVEDGVEAMVTTSADAAAGFGKRVGLAFIDGAHDYESVCEDIEAWAPHLAPGATVAFHDVMAEWPGVGRAIRERLVGAGRVDRLRFVHSIVYARYVGRASRADRAVAGGTMAYKRGLDGLRPAVDGLARRVRRMG